MVISRTARLAKRIEEIRSRWPELQANLYDKALFDGVPFDEAVRWFAYFFSVPKKQGKQASLRSHVLALYDPFAKRSLFPAGIRFSCNTYVGCGLQCAYCYIQSYFNDPLIVPYTKSDFTARLEKDFDELETLGLPAQPLHFSNSTDALQEKLESQYENTLHLLKRLAQGEHRFFNPVRMLTRNPARLLRPEYLESLEPLQDKITIQVSLPILNPQAGRIYEPNVPPASERLQVIEQLRAEGIKVSIRIDPLYPREPLPARFFSGKRLSDFGLVQAQQEDELRQLVRHAARLGCESVIVSALKIPKKLSPRNQRVMQGWVELYQSVSKEYKYLNSKNFYRLPREYQHHELIEPILDEARKYCLKVEHCKNNLIHARKKAYASGVRGSSEVC